MNTTVTAPKGGLYHMERVLRTSRLLSLGVSVGLAVLSVAAQADIFFEEHFDGNALDTTKWNADIGTAGARWCPEVESLCLPGEWVDPAVDPCHGVTYAPPYGAFTVANGHIAITNSVSRAFPYIWSGPPSRSSPFPASVDFILEVRMKYDDLQDFGDGLRCVFWSDSTPIGSNSPCGSLIVFSIWADAGGLRAGVLGETIFLPNPLDSHHYALEYSGGNFTLFVDGARTLGPLPGGPPNTVWFGNPVFTHWGERDWTDFAIDFLRVTIPLVPVQPTTWGRVKVRGK